MDITAYLDRIAYCGPREPTVETLRALHLAHLLAVPFENLSIGRGEPIVLDQAALFDKIVRRRRGGFCYELNGLFAALLRGLGFGVTMISAGVAKGDGGFGPEFDHLTLLVTTDDRQPTTALSPDKRLTTDNGQLTTWLADVGFGDSFREPLAFELLKEQPEGFRSYRVARDGAYHTLEQREGEGDWAAQYQFTLQPRQHADFAGMCHYHQTSPQSGFTQRRICTRATPGGRITLSDMRLITTTDGQRQERLLADEHEYRSALREHFDIELA